MTPVYDISNMISLILQETNTKCILSFQRINVVTL